MTASQKCKIILITFSPELADKEKLGGNYSREILSKLEILTKHKLRIYSLFKMTYFASPNNSSCIPWHSLVGGFGYLLH